jgi:hypothetical protein
MGALLLHNPWIQFYLVWVGALGIAFIWDYMRGPTATEDGTPTSRRKPFSGERRFPRPPITKNFRRRCRGRGGNRFKM